MKQSILEAGFKVVVIACLALVIVLHFSKTESIVFVDAIKLVNGYKGMQAARKGFELRTSAWKANIDTLKTELDAKIKTYEATHKQLTSKEKALTEELLQTKHDQLVNYQNVIAEKIKQEDKELTSQVLGKVNDYLKKYGEAKGYGIIMAATQYGNIVYAQKGKDITDEVLKGLNGEITN
jgi:outer membrane protein